MAPEPAAVAQAPVLLLPPNAFQVILASRKSQHAFGVVQEDARVEASCKDLLKGDFHSFGERLYASHAGLRDEYEVSCAELDMLVETSAGIDGVYGSRMMGGGFGGCTINLVDESAVHAFIEGMTRAYKARMNRDLKTYVCTLTAGTCRITD